MTYDWLRFRVGCEQFGLTVKHRSRMLKGQKLAPTRERPALDVHSVTMSWRRFCRQLMQDEQVVAGLTAVAKDPEHRHYAKVMELLTSHGEGRPVQRRQEVRRVIFEVVDEAAALRERRREVAAALEAIEEVEEVHALEAAPSGGEGAEG